MAGDGVKKRKCTVAVALGSSVSVLRGVGVKVVVGVNVGRAASVWVAAATAVCAMIVPIEFGSMMGAGAEVAKVGTHAMINSSAVNQVRYFIFCVAICLLLTLSNQPFHYVFS